MSARLKNNRLKFWAVALLVLALPEAALAAKDPRSIQLDHRVRTAIYQPDEVYKFIGHYGFQSSIEFAQDEEVDTISMGDSTAWMINPSGHRLFIKPLEQDATTNMTVITNRRTYLFELHAREATGIDDSEMMFVMRFVYNDSDTGQTVQRYLDSVPVPDLVNEPGKYNFRYTISGPEHIAPIRIFDDGEFTYFEFRGKNADVPAFFLVNADGSESLINYRTRGNYLVLERVAPRLTLRYGNDIVCVFNEMARPRTALAQ